MYSQNAADQPYGYRAMPNYQFPQGNSYPSGRAPQKMANSAIPGWENAQVYFQNGESQWAGNAKIIQRETPGMGPNPFNTHQISQSTVEGGRRTSGQRDAFGPGERKEASGAIGHMVNEDIVLYETLDWIKGPMTQRVCEVCGICHQSKARAIH